MPFSQQPMPFAAGDFENDVAVRERLRAGEMLAARGVYGLVWIDQTLVVRRRFGVLAEFVELNAPLAQSIPAVIGLEEDIAALLANPDGVLRIPSLSLISTAGAGPRLNLVFYCIEQQYILVVARAGADSSLEIELSRQIRARLMAEAAVAAKSQELFLANAELRIANAKLEQFALIVAHDLRAPMRALSHMADEIEGAVTGGDEKAARSKLAELRRQSARLSSMLSALMRYSSASPGELAIEQVDTGALVADVVRSLPARRMQIDVRGSWPRLETFAAPLDLVLRNLIDNAVKHHDRDGGRITINCADHPSALEISVADDGPGIAAEHYESIFLPFRTLSGTGEGMGLAIVQKMVAAAGGAIHVRGNTDQSRGVTFIVHWPK
jgi:signal transduction histidine kinase